jgi:hypothetical protein
LLAQNHLLRETLTQALRKKGIFSDRCLCSSPVNLEPIVADAPENTGDGLIHGHYIQSRISS